MPNIITTVINEKNQDFFPNPVSITYLLGMICESQINHKFLTKNLDRVSIPNKKLGSTCLSLSIRPERLLSDYGPSIYYVSKEVGG